MAPELVAKQVEELAGELVEELAGELAAKQAGELVAKQAGELVEESEVSESQALKPRTLAAVLHRHRRQIPLGR